MQTDFDVDRSIRVWVLFGFNQVKRSWLLLYIVGIAIEAPFWLGFSFGIWGSMLSLLWVFFLYPVLTIGYEFWLLEMARKEESVHASSVLAAFKSYWPLVGALIIYILGGLIALLLLIVPGIIFFIRYYFAFLAIIDKKLGIRDALAWSTKITNGHKAQLFLLYFALWVVEITLLLASRGLFSICTGTSFAVWGWKGPWFISAIPDLLFMPWYYASIVAAYFSLTKKAELGDAKAKTEGIDAAR